MADLNLEVILKARRGTTEQWASSTYQFSAGEFGLDTTTGEFRVATADNQTWSQLSFVNKSQIEALINSAKTELQGNIDAKLDTATYNSEKANFATKTTVDGIQSIISDYGDIVTHNAAEFATAEYVGTIPEESEATSVIDYIDEKTQGIASDEVVTQLSNRVTTAEGEIDALQTGQTTLDGKIDAETARATGAESALSTRLDTVEDKLENVTTVMDFAGAFEALPDASSHQNGDVVVITAGENVGKEFVLSGGTWVEFGSTTAQDAAITQLQGDVEELEGRVDTLESKPDANTTYTAAATETPLQFTLTPSEGAPQTVTLKAPTVDVGVTKVTAGNADIEVSPAAGTGQVSVSHKTYAGTGLTISGVTEPYFLTGLNLSNGHVTGGSATSLGEALQTFRLILDGGSASGN